MSTGPLFAGIIFGAIGTGYFIYGKKQSHFLAMLCGIGLCVVPYLISNTWLIVLASLVLMGIPFYLNE